MNESFSGTLEGDSSEEEDGEDKVGEESCEVDNLATGLDTFDETHADNKPSSSQTNY